MTDEERQKLCAGLRHAAAYNNPICDAAAEEIERLAALAQSDAEPDDPLPREHQDPSKWPTRETVERAHAAQSDAEPTATRALLREAVHMLRAQKARY
jgi:hypothetical protein